MPPRTIRTPPGVAALVAQEPEYHHRNGRLIGYTDLHGDLLYSIFDGIDAPVPTGPAASFGYACGNSATCTFTSTSVAGSSPVTEWAWSSSAGHSRIGATTAFTFAAAGSFTVRLTITDGNGLGDEAVAGLTCSSHVRHGVRCK
jgi:hypothetical protein